MWTRSCISSLSASSLCWLVESVKSRYVSSVDLSTFVGTLDQQPGAFYKRRQEKTTSKNQSGPATPKEDVRSDGAPDSIGVWLLGWFCRKHRLWVITATSHMTTICVWWSRSRSLKDWAVACRERHAHRTIIRMPWWKAKSNVRPCKEKPLWRLWTLKG